MTRIWRLDDYTPYDNTVYDENMGEKLSCILFAVLVLNLVRHIRNV